jgi:hypothetical protein
MSKKVDYKDFPQRWGSQVTDAHGRVYDNWKVGFSSKNGSVMITQTLSTSGSTATAVHSVTIGAKGFHEFNSPKREEDPLDFK